MTIKEDYCQSKPKIQINVEDENIQLWWMAKDMDGNIFPVELQMSIYGALEMISELDHAVVQLQDAKFEKIKKELKLF